MIYFYPSLHIVLLALTLRAASNPLPPHPTRTTQAPTKPCTTYITKIIPGMWTPTTIYTTTKTVFSQVPCYGCVLATTTLYAPGAGPWGDEFPTTTLTASVPFNFTSVVCSSTPHLPPRPTHRPTVVRRVLLGKRGPVPDEPDEALVLDNPDPNLTIPHTPRPTTQTQCGTYTITAKTETGTTHPAITMPAPGRTNPIEPTTTFAVLKLRETAAPAGAITITKTITLTLTTKSWSSTTTTTKYTTCYLGPLQEAEEDQAVVDPGTFPRRKSTPPPDHDNECVTPPKTTKTTSTYLYKTITLPETGILTRTTVKCTKTVLTRRPKPTWSLGLDGQDSD